MVQVQRDLTVAHSEDILLDGGRASRGTLLWYLTSQFRCFVCFQESWFEMQHKSPSQPKLAANPFVSLLKTEAKQLRGKPGEQQAYYVLPFSSELTGKIGGSVGDANNNTKDPFHLLELNPSSGGSMHDPSFPASPVRKALAQTPKRTSPARIQSGFRSTANRSPQRTWHQQQLASFQLFSGAPARPQQEKDVQGHRPQSFLLEQSNPTSKHHHRSNSFPGSCKRFGRSGSHNRTGQHQLTSQVLRAALAGRVPVHMVHNMEGAASHQINVAVILHAALNGAIPSGMSCDVPS